MQWSCCVFWELNQTQYSISICFCRRTPSPSSSCSSKSSKSSSSSPITPGAFTVKSSSYSQMSFLQLLFFLSLKPLNSLPNQWAPLRVEAWTIILKLGVAYITDHLGTREQNLLRTAGSGLASETLILSSTHGQHLGLSGLI